MVSPLQITPSRPVPGSNRSRRRGQSWKYGPLWTWDDSFFCCCCCTDVCTIILFSLFLFDIWPCFMYFGRCTFAWVSSVALFYHGWRRREMFNECFLRAPLWPLKRGDNFLVLIFIFLAQMTKKKRDECWIGSLKENKSNVFLLFYCGSHWKQTEFAFL